MHEEITNIFKNIFHIKTLLQASNTEIPNKKRIMIFY